jgi:hypothetical protein
LEGDNQYSVQNNQYLAQGIQHLEVGLGNQDNLYLVQDIQHLELEIQYFEKDIPNMSLDSLLVVDKDYKAGEVHFDLNIDFFVDWTEYHNFLDIPFLGNKLHLIFCVALRDIYSIE